MGSNKSAKQKLIQKYGNIDFLDQMKIKVPKCKIYKSKCEKKRMQKLTYHHIKMKKDAGKATVENGALLTGEHHVWFHQQSQEIQTKLNDAFQEFKRKKDQQLEINFEDEIDIPFEISITEFDIDCNGNIKSYNRAKIKEETRKLIEKELEDR